MDRCKLALLFLFLFLAVGTFNIGKSIPTPQKIENNIVVVKVLIYDGMGTGKGSINGIKKGLNEGNKMNLVPNTYFEYNTSSKINSSILSGYDVLIMPGGTAITYIHNQDIDPDSIKKFVKEGKGYLGICAGAYAASPCVDGYYKAWGIVPNVNTKNVKYTGTLPLKINSLGRQLINVPIYDMHMENGPAMYSNNSGIVMAEYADNKTGYPNSAAIIGQSIGSGRVILSGPHPELNTPHPHLLVYMVLWTASKI